MYSLILCTASNRISHTTSTLLTPLTLLESSLPQLDILSQDLADRRLNGNLLSVFILYIH